MAAEYLAIEPFLQDALQARTLHAAFDLGVIDRLQQTESLSVSQAFHGAACDAAGCRFMLQVLQRCDVITVESDDVRLSPAFRTALQFRDLLETKLQFAELVSADFLSGLPRLLRSAEEFMATSTLFELFDYSRCHEITPQNCLQAARWMKLTTMLTRYEAPECCRHFSFDQHRHMLDLGGNSGEFARQVCRQAKGLYVTVGDLPVVCHVGRRHVADFPEADRIQFQSLSFLEDEWPVGCDLISFKSVLHDWPDDLAELLIARAFQTLPQDGRLLIFERQACDFRVDSLAWGQLPVLLFFRSYRRPSFYEACLQSAGFCDIQCQRIDLEVPFLLIHGRKTR